MKFGPVPIAAAAGTILGHNVSDHEGKRRLRKGRELTEADVLTLRGLGYEEVWVAEREADDVDEERAAEAVTAALLGPCRAEELALTLSGPRTGRVNLRSSALGVLHVDEEQVHTINRMQGLTVATKPSFAVVEPGAIVATVKILPYFVAAQHLDRASEISKAGPAVEVRALEPKRVGLLVHGHAGGRDKTVESFTRSLSRRLTRWNAKLEGVRFVATDRAGAVEELARVVAAEADRHDLLLIAGETAVQDRHDLAPTAIERAGGTLTCFGAPVDPGNLLLLANRGAKTLFGVPGCARSPKTNIIDLLLPRLLVGELLDEESVAELGVGGLLDDVPERPFPRHRV